MAITAKIDTFLNNPDMKAGIMNPDTGELDFKGTFEELMAGRFNESKADSIAMADELQHRVYETNNKFKDEKNKIIGENESKTVTRKIDESKAVINPAGLSGEVAKHKGRKKINEKRKEAGDEIEALRDDLEQVKTTKHGKPSDHVARRIAQGYILFERTDAGWDIIASTFDKFIDNSVLGVISQAALVAPIVLVVGGKRIAADSGLNDKGIRNLIMQQANSRARSIISSFWAKRKK